MNSSLLCFSLLIGIVFCQTCADLKNPSTGVSDCASRISLCNNPSYYSFMTTQCPKTCGRCTTTNRQRHKRPRLRCKYKNPSTTWVSARQTCTVPRSASSPLACASKTRISRLIKDFKSDLPPASVNFAFAYGSGAVSQENERMEDKMVDLVLCTKDPQQSTAKVFYNTQIRTKNGRLIRRIFLTAVGCSSRVAFRNQSLT